MNEWEWSVLEDKEQLDHIEIGGVKVKIGDRVQGSLTPLARWTDAPFENFIAQP